MRLDTIRKAVLPPGPILVLTLIGLMLLSTILYNRAVRIQRFLEPALAMSQPRTTFYSDIGRLLMKEFGTDNVRGIRYVGRSIEVEKSLIFTNPYHIEKSLVLKKLGKVFLAVLSDPATRANLDFIVVSPRVSLGPDRKANKMNRLQVQSTAEVILNALFDAEPELEKAYSIYFESSAMSVYARGEEENWVEFRIVPSDRLHIDVLQRLEKYVQ
jgi:hypothetical protein